MKRLLVFGLILVFITACGGNEPPFVDNGNPGQARAVVFYDDNKNGVMDDGEAGAPHKVAITDHPSCVSDPSGFLPTDSDGIIIFGDLKPGPYCLAVANGYGMTTKMNVQTYVSSDLVTTVYFGVVREP